MVRIPFFLEVYSAGLTIKSETAFQSAMLERIFRLSENQTTVLTRGFMVDPDREKISKSKQHQGGYEKPQTSEAYIKKWGADIMRLWVSSQDFRNDIIVSEKRICARCVKAVSQT